MENEVAHPEIISCGKYFAKNMVDEGKKLLS
jgi:hypothetical protein